MKTTRQEYTNQLNVILEFGKSGRPVQIDLIPFLFREDFNHFFMGETLQAQQGKVVVGPTKYKQWIKKIWNIGLDYSLDLDKS